MKRQIDNRLAALEAQRARFIDLAQRLQSVFDEGRLGRAEDESYIAHDPALSPVAELLNLARARQRAAQGKRR